MRRTTTGFAWLVSDDIGAAKVPMEARVEIWPHGGIGIRPEPDMGEMATINGFGFPIVIERTKGVTRLIVWADINSEIPTHFINLEGAREKARTDA